MNTNTHQQPNISTKFLQRFAHKPESINQDVGRFERAMLSAIFAMIIMALISGIMWIGNSRDIVMVVPLEKHEATCPDTTDICTYLNSDLDTNRYHSLSVLGVVGIGSIIASFILPILAYGTANSHKTLKQLATGRMKLLRNIIVAIVIAGFVAVLMEVLTIMFGLLVPREPLNAVPYLIAVLTSSALVGLVSFVVFNWTEKSDVSNISSLAILVLVVSLLLSIFFTTSDWSTAFSALGTQSTAFPIAGSNGSSGLFRFTFVSMGLILWAYVIDVARLYLGDSNIVHEHRHNRTFIAFAVGLLGFLAGLGAISVGIFPSDTYPLLHDAGAYGAPIASGILIAILAYVFPYHKEHEYRDNRNIVRASGSVIIVILVIVGGMKLFSIGDGIVTTLIAEFVFIFCMLLFLQVFALYLTEFLDEEAEEQKHANQNPAAQLPSVKPSDSSDMLPSLG